VLSFFDDDRIYQHGLNFKKTRFLVSFLRLIAVVPIAVSIIAEVHVQTTSFEDDGSIPIHAAIHAG
jgi:hypothetical protein